MFVFFLQSLIIITVVNIFEENHFNHHHNYQIHVIISCKCHIKKTEEIPH